MPQLHPRQFWVFPVPVGAELVQIQSRFSWGEITPCKGAWTSKDQHWPSNTPTGLYNTHLSREIQTSHGRVGGWAGTCGSGMKVTRRTAAVSNQMVLRNITAPGRESQAWRCFFFCNFSHVYSPLPCPHASSSCSAPSRPSLALCKLWPQLLAALGPSWGLEIAKHYGLGKPGHAAGLQKPLERGGRAF